MLFARRQINIINASDHIDQRLQNLNPILNIFQETQDFLFLTDSVIICIYLRKSQPKVFKKPPKVISWSEELQISKLLKWDLIHSISTFWDLSLGLLLQGRHLLFIKKIWNMKTLDKIKTLISTKDQKCG